VFNEPKFLQEFRDLVLSEVFGMKVLEIGCYSGEMLEALGTGEGVSLKVAPENEKCVHRGDVREFAKQEGNLGQYDLVFSCGVLEHFKEDEAVEILGAMKKLVKAGGKVLNYVPNVRCEPYMRAKEKTGAEWAKERAFSVEEFERLHQKAGLVVIDSGTAAGEWVKRFGGDPKNDEPYLVYCLAKRSDESGNEINVKVVK